MRRRTLHASLRRVGCMPCKRRHKRCDEQKPRCGRCEWLDLDCKPPELFKTSKAGSYCNGILADHGCNSVSTCMRTSTPKEALEDEASNSDVMEIMNDDRIAAVDTSSHEALKGIRAQSTTDVSTITTVNWPASRMERCLLYHYTYRVSAVLVNVDSSSNPLRSVLLPRALSSPTLMDALYATSAMHAFMGNRKAEFRKLSLVFYDKAINALRQGIANLDHQQDPATLETLLLISIYLCKWEIISGGTHWRAHFKGIQQLWEADKVQNSLVLMDFKAAAFIRSFIAYHTYILGLTRCLTLPEPTADVFKHELGKQVSEHDSTIDPYMGTYSDLVSLLYRIVDIAIVDASKPTNLVLMMKETIRIYRQLPQSITQPILLQGTRNGLNVITMRSLNHIASAYRHATIAQMHMVLDLIETNTAEDHLLLQCIGLRTLLNSSKVDEISSCLVEMSLVPDDKPCAVGLVPLLFLVAIETSDSNEHEVAVERLQHIVNTACLGNVATALKLLQVQRQIKSENWRQLLRNLGWDIIIA